MHKGSIRSPLTWAVHLSVLFLVVIWTLPTAGLFISALLDKDQIVASGWWTALSTSTQSAMYRAPGAESQVEEGGTFVISGNIFEGGKGIVTAYQIPLEITYTYENDVLTIIYSENITDSGTVTFYGDDEFVWEKVDKNGDPYTEDYLRQS